MPTSTPSTLQKPERVDAQRIVDGLHEPLLLLDEELTIRQVNPAFTHAFSAAPDEVVGQSVYEFGGSPFDIPKFRAHLRAVVDEGRSFEKFEIDHVFGDLGRRVLQVNGQKLASTGDKSERILLAIRDITQQRELQETLRRRSKELESSNADLEQFAYAASHDLQEPLRMVSSYLQLLDRRYKEDLDETAREFIEYAVDGADRMKSLINGLLQYSRVGRKEGEFEEVDLEAVVDDVLSDLSRRQEELGASVTRKSLPTVYGNRDQLRRVFQNLIENALTYHGDPPPQIEITEGDGREAGAHVVVQDDGPGIPPEAHDKVFRIFKQLDPHGMGREGSGMGLALTRKIVERHDGQIWVESEPGDGAAFHLTLRLSPDPNSSLPNS